MTAFNFQKQNKVGKLGEALFFEAHKDELVREDGFKRDFTVAATGEGLELKTDFYSITETPNFFFERFSNLEKRTPGGPWQAAANGTAYFAYLFAPSLTFYLFPTDALVAELEKIEITLKPREIRNESHITLGYCVPREALGELARPYQLCVCSTAALSLGQPATPPR